MGSRRLFRLAARGRSAPGSVSTLEKARPKLMRDKGKARAEPQGSIRWPFLKQLPDGRNEVERAIRKVAFRHRLESRYDTSASGGFTDYTTRYGGIRADEEGAVTLQTHLLEHVARQGAQASTTDIQQVARMLDVDSLLDMPLMVLSNGQTRRARIARALLSRPELLVLEEPFTGLDVTHRASLAAVLCQLHARQAPRILMTLRPQDDVPDWITHVVDFTPDGSISHLGLRPTLAPKRSPPAASRCHRIKGHAPSGKTLASLRGVSVSGRRPVLCDVSWDIKAGERWLLKGHNGSGKTTLLSIILGDHPQSFSLGDAVQLFGRRRSTWATSQLQGYIGHASPEINNAFPRRGDLSTREAIGTGFENVFCYRPLSVEQSDAIDRMASELGRTTDWLGVPFVEQRAGEQAVALLMRALVKKPPLVILDEPMAGMDDSTIERVHRYLDSGLDPDQSLILVTHYEAEVPPSVDLVLELSEGRIVRNG